MALSGLFLSMSDPYNLLIVLPLLYAYMLGSFTGLRKWIAIQQVPAPTSLPETSQADAVVAARTQRIIAVTVGCVLFFVAVFALCAAAVRFKFEDFLEYLDVATVVPLFFVTSLVASLEWSGVPLTWHRTLKGNVRPVVHMAELSKAKKIFVKSVIAIMSVGLPTGAILYRSDTCASAMLFVTLFAITGMQDQKTNSLRKVIITAVVTEVAMLSYIGIIIAAVLYADDDKEAIDVNRLALGRGQDWMYTLFAAAPLSRLFATALRFDFANLVEATQSPTPVIDVQVVPAPVAKAPGRQLTTGVKAPSHWAVVTVPFKRRYFQAVLAPWILAHIITYVLIDQGLLPSLGRAAYTLYAMLLSIPLIVTALVTVALVRGEGKKMWKYEEVWAVKPVAAEASVAATAGAAAYEEVKEKYEDLVGVLVNVE